MDIYSWVIFMYVAGTVVVGWFLLHEVSSVPKTKQKFVGPSYWGFYNDRSVEAVAVEQTIKLHDLNGV